MRRKLTALALMFCMMTALFTIPAYALQDPVMLVVDSVAYGDGQNTLIANGHFVNTSNKSVLSVMDTQLEIKSGNTVVASEVFEVAKQKVFSIAVGSAEPWQFVFKNPVKGLNLSTWSADSSVSYNLAKPQELTSGKKIYYNGVPISFDVAPAVINGRLMIPARAVFEKMGCVVQWDANSQSVKVAREGQTVAIYIGETVMNVNEGPVKLDVPATILDGRTLVPLRAIATALGAGITYGELNEMAVIYE